MIEADSPADSILFAKMIVVSEKFSLTVIDVSIPEFLIVLSAQYWKKVVL